MQDFERMGAFYLGRPYDLQARSPKPGWLLYDSKDLVTHAVCVGMTGSGKTGLCLALLEEAAIDGIPAIAIDPKGDLSNLLLTFPQLRGEDFLPWINEEDARKKGLSGLDYANQQADLWRNGLVEWQQDGSRIERLREAADFDIYTPGSNAGMPVSILKSFSVPDPAVLEDSELFRDQVNGTATSLLALLGIDVDPIQSREHILISILLSAAWKQRQGLDLAALIQQIQAPPMRRIGVLELESFYPSKERFGLAMRLNNLLAAPGFENWMDGDGLNINSLLYASSGRPRVTIFSIAHLNDAERMFFVSLLLNQILTWVRTQSGTTSLRAIVFMDEIFGYFPPVSNPPSKAPLLTLLKQARAFGVGVVLATQNPVDLDYKGLSNTGTWFIGRLQTERDKARVLDGLEGAAAGASSKFARQQIEQILAGLGNRIFLMNNVHDDVPEVFETRWALSYLRGPLTRSQIKTLKEQRKSCRVEQAGHPPQTQPESERTLQAAETLGAAATTPSGGQQQTSQRPVLPPEIPQYFLPLRGSQPVENKLLYRPTILGCATLYFTDTKAGVEAEQNVSWLAPISDGTPPVDWQEGKLVESSESDLEKSPAEEAVFATLPSEAGKGKNYETWKRSFAEMLFRNQRLELFKSPAFKQYSQPGESERDFRIRLQQVAREERDRRKELLRHKYAPKMTALQERIRRAKQAVDREAEQAKQQKFQTSISFGTTLLGAFLGRKAVNIGTLGKATTAARGVGRSLKEGQDVARAQETAEALQQQLAELEFQFQSEAQTQEMKMDPLTENLDNMSIRPKKTGITVRLLALVWTPHWLQPDGSTTTAWE